jgi:L-arginine dehydrogenase
VSNPPVLRDADLEPLIAALPVASVLERAFLALREGLAVQPPQSLTPFPGERGDCIAYLGVLGHLDVFGAKLSPYIVTGGEPVITAWTMLMSMKTGQPLLICDAGRLTVERTAGVTALAVDKLARKDSAVLAVVGAGAVARAHIRHALNLRAWKEIRVHSPSLSGDRAKREACERLDPRVACVEGVRRCAAGADVIMLATSSGTPVVDAADIGPRALVTSISTNAPRAREIDPALLPGMDVYCDDKSSTPASAGEMALAAEAGLWSADRVVGDLADLCAGACPLPAYDKPVFFRSIGLGIEDIAIAHAVCQQFGRTAGT